MEDKEPIVNLKGVCICRDENVILSNFDLQIEPGGFVYISGPVGSGKSSLLRSLYAEIPISEGQAQVVGFDLRQIKRSRLCLLRRQIGIVFQDFQLLYHLTAEENLDIVLRAISVKRKSDRQKRIAEVLEQVGMGSKGYKRPHELSGGEQQRIAIARALLGHPKLILADEPTGNLDAQTGLEITRLLQRMAAREGAAVLMATHNRQVMEQLPARHISLQTQRGAFGLTSNEDKTKTPEE